MGKDFRVWATHLKEKSLTVGDRDVNFDSAGRSGPLTEEEFDSLMRIDCFSSDGPIPSSRDFVPSAFTVNQWLCSVGLSTLLVESLSESQQETLALDLRTIGAPFNLSTQEFGAKMKAEERRPEPLPAVGFDTVEQFGPPEPLIEGHATDCECEDCGHEWLKANMSDPAPEDTSHLTGAEQLDTYIASGGIPNPVETGFQASNAAAVLGLEEEPEGDPGDLIDQFKELKNSDARAEFIMAGGLSRPQLDLLFNTEQGTKSLRNRTVLTAIQTALAQLPNRTAESINQALVKLSAKE